MPPEPAITIELRDLSIIAGAFALRKVSLSVRAGEYAALMGRTGQGKTTILEAVAGLRKIEAGEIILAGRNVTQLPPAERGVGYVPQDLALFPTMSVRANLAFALKIRGVPKTERTARVADLAGWLGIAPLLERRVTSLSGGEAQRTALGRALSFQPQVLLLDEPFSALDDATREEMHQLMHRVREHTGVTVLHVTHNRAEAAALADRVIVIESGALVESQH